ncbi:MAG: formate/nitrite transporter family protein [Hominisplanchenecus sp.]|nr:formate/nitrite transporter family protein [Hominisplanchenecus sp.]
MFRDEYNAVCNAAKNKLNLLEKNPVGYVAASFMAGAFIALGSILMGIMGGYFSAAGSPATKLVSGLVFSIGLCFVFMAGAELFTGNNFVMSAASLKGEVPWGKTIKLWVVCYLGNLLGSVVFGVLFTMTGLMGGEEVGTFFQNAAAAKIAGAPLNLFAKAILCNICVCAAVWCSIKMKSETGKIMMAIAGVMTFVSSGFEHSIANMTFLTIGLLTPGSAAISLGGALYNLLIVTAGNMVGGILFVAVPYYLIQKEK